MTLRPGEVVLVRIGKVRPAVVLLDSADDDFVAAPITSRPRVSDFDVPLIQWREAGLNTASTIRVHKLTVLAKDEIARRLGELAAGHDRIALAEALRRAFSLDR
jgi:mRNA-degrading endonuclease toxin of MazEF toxin-antitoxin module